MIEGVMGLFDGRLGTAGEASTAHVAALTGSPVLLVVDISHASRTHAAVITGLSAFDAGVRIAGVILNKAASARHADEVRDALGPSGIPVLGVLPRDDGIETPSRHLGLVPAAERAESARTLERMAEVIAAHVDTDAVMHIARGAEALHEAPWDPRQDIAPPTPARPVVAMAGGRAFTFRYAETEKLLRAAGCDVVEFDPLVDGALPAGTAGIYLGGGFPEVHAAELAENRALIAGLRSAVAAGVPTVAECAGLLYLCRSLDGTPMVGAVPADAAMKPRLTLGYRTATSPADSLLTAAGEQVHGHEFHRTAITSVDLDGHAAWQLLRAPKASPRRHCTRHTCTRTGRATPLWPNDSPTPSTAYVPSQSTASATSDTTGIPDGTAGRRTITTGIPNSSAAFIFGQVYSPPESLVTNTSARCSRSRANSPGSV